MYMYVHRGGYHCYWLHLRCPGHTPFTGGPSLQPFFKWRDSCGEGERGGQGVKKEGRCRRDRLAHSPTLLLSTCTCQPRPQGSLVWVGINPLPTNDAHMRHGLSIGIMGELILVDILSYVVSASLTHYPLMATIVAILAKLSFLQNWQL